MLSQKDASVNNGLYFPVSIAGMMLSWMLVHSTYTFHYTRMYYDDDDANAGKDALAWNFPETPGRIISTSLISLSLSVALSRCLT